ncbi:Flagellum-specific ATP synthase [Pseudidiomarina piscicola]|uniref:Flagellum-specific ATP synthase n=1 Tax=Pseudidiomarina piscicola TaxID=2614830 RepID=A0A6S6WUU9_9GAMM|nr:flagellar protein export ATPase FliI [Pseudidiomarina piscicola]CAB0151052.1 Flagellum-specific ATP synthase [Pseudidiomarina piscicola]VZT40562.1 Flagellum-specific ATP synthase [Pseudomonas aeruginosa]
MEATNSHLANWQTAIDRVNGDVQQQPKWTLCGKLVRATGMVLEAVGIQLPVGSACLIANGASKTEAEVVGFADNVTYLMPLDSVRNLAPGALVMPLAGQAQQRRFPLGEQLLGRVIDGAGNPIDGRKISKDTPYGELTSKALNPLSRAPIQQPLDVGIRAINALLTIGRGQRIGLFAGSGVGKSVLLGMMARYTKADVIVVGLIGERGREVQEFIENILGESGRQRSVVVASPADASPLERLQGASYATRLAESFRDEGKHVLLLMDSLTRYAMAQREIALAIGEPPVTKGYPPSVFAKIPALVERAGNGPRNGGAITAFYTVLTEGDDQQDPIADSARAILDGHIVLSRELAESGHYPAIDVEASISRVMSSVVSSEQLQAARRMKKLFSVYQRNRDLVSVGAYSPGHDPLLDQAVQKYPKIEHFLQQQMDEQAHFDAAIEGLGSL